METAQAPKATTEPTPTEQLDERWPAIESNPDVMTQLGHDLGLPRQWVFGDVWGLDDDFLMMIPQPVIALVLLFPSTKKTPVDEKKKKRDDLFFLHQVDALDSACGTIAIVHAAANNLEKLGIARDSVIATFVGQAKEKTFHDRGEAMAKHPEIFRLHRQFSRQGQTTELKKGVSSGHHFVCFTEVDGELYEFDGCKPFPTCHGSVTPATFVRETAKVIRENYMNDPTVLDFSIISLAPAAE